MPSSICIHCPDTPPEQQTRVVTSYKPSQVDHHEERHSLDLIDEEASQDWQQEKPTRKQKRSLPLEKRSHNSQYYNTIGLSVALSNQSRLEAINRTIRVIFDCIYPFATNNVLSRG
jgi:hypothetical protein